MRFVFFGTPEFSAITLDELKHAGFLPSLIVSAPDKPKGRHLVLTESEVSTWGKREGISVVTPTKIDEAFMAELGKTTYDLFIVAAYGKILPQTLLDMPKHGTLNVHPSLLPKFRGSSPIESAILSMEKETGVTIMLLDAQMDHGPLLAQKVIPALPWPPKGTVLTELLAHEGGKLLAECLLPWTAGTLKATPQDHTQATFTKKIKKEDGEVDITSDPHEIYKKIQAYNEWPGTYFFIEKMGKKSRILIKEAHLEAETLIIDRVVPEGGKEMLYRDLMRNLGRE